LVGLEWALMSSLKKYETTSALVALYDPVALGVRSIHAEIQKAGFSSDLVFFKNEIGTYGVWDKQESLANWPTEKEFRLFEELLLAQKPKVLGISFRSFALEMVIKITKRARDSIDPVIVWGGTHPTVMPDECLEYADIVCIGEGEEAFLELLQAIEENKSYRDIENFYFSEDSKTQKNPLRPLIQDLDGLAFPVMGDDQKFTIDDNKLIERDPHLSGGSHIIYHIMGARGCPFQCDFCTNSALRDIYRGLGKFIRKRSPESVIQELEAASKNLNVLSVAFLDEIFGMDKAWTREFVGFYNERIAKPLIVDLYPSSVDDEVGDLLVDTGVALCHMGVQSGSERSRKNNYNRNTPDESIQKAARILHERKTITFFDFIMDNPYEDEEDLRSTLNTLLSLPRPFNAKLLSLCYFPKTKITMRALADGLITEKDLDYHTKKSFSQHWANFENNIDLKNAFYGTLFWLSLLKYRSDKMALDFFSAQFGDSFHVLPTSFVKFVSNSSYLKKRPEILFRTSQTLIGIINKVLVFPRLVRTFLRLLIRGDFTKILSGFKKRA
jgi:radical SAM superfamily enzyme YgiQ (UPF0313 family)